MCATYHYHSQISQCDSTVSRAATERSFPTYPPPPRIGSHSFSLDQSEKKSSTEFLLIWEQLLDRRCVTTKPIDLYNGKIYRSVLCLHPLPIKGIKRGFIKLDTLRGHSRLLLPTAFIPSKSLLSPQTKTTLLSTDSPAPKYKTEIR